MTTDLKNTDGTEPSKKALKINQDLQELKRNIRDAKRRGIEQYRIEALENYQLKLEYDLSVELNKWSYENLW
tara:strand:- start:1950 stop:2165 length:216 start_codon:yes stop_codon:yes gene_type:complete